MKKVTSQIIVAVVCALLGFLLSYQFKVLSKSSSEENKYDDINVINEIESLRKENDELKKTNSALNDNLKQLEENGKKNGDISKEISTQLEEARMQIGTESVKGQGITVTITPRTSVFANNNSDSIKTLGEDELIHMTNILWFAKSEAISINDMRITTQTGIKNSGNYIWVGSLGKVSPEEKIVIKAIGDKTKLGAGLKFQDNLTYKNLNNYDIVITPSDDIIIEKTNQVLKNEFIKPVKE